MPTDILFHSQESAQSATLLLSVMALQAPAVCEISSLSPWLFLPWHNGRLVILKNIPQFGFVWYFLIVGMMSWMFGKNTMDMRPCPSPGVDIPTTVMPAWALHSSSVNSVALWHPGCGSGRCSHQGKLVRGTQGSLYNFHNFSTGLIPVKNNKGGNGETVEFYWSDCSSVHEGFLKKSMILSKMLVRTDISKSRY